MDFDKLVDLTMLLPHAKSKEDVMIHISYTFSDCPDPTVEVKQSKHGRGVFAVKDIKKGEIATVYPTHLIINKTPREDGLVEALGRCEYDKDYTFDVSPTLTHQGDPTCENPNFLGHLINDFYHDVSELNTTGESIIKYMMHLFQSSNTTFTKKKHFVYIEATKDIKAGEELLIPYTPLYWTDFNGQDEMLAVLRNYLAELGKTNPKKQTFLLDFFYKNAGGLLV